MYNIIKHRQPWLACLEQVEKELRERGRRLQIEGEDACTDMIAMACEVRVTVVMEPLSSLCHVRMSWRTARVESFVRSFFSSPDPWTGREGKHLILSGCSLKRKNNEIIVNVKYL